MLVYSQSRESFFHVSLLGIIIVLVFAAYLGCSHAINLITH